MAELPYMKFYVADYLRDTEILSLSAQGGWMRMLASMWHPSRRGVLSLRLPALARLLGANEQTTKSIVDEIEDCCVAEVAWDGDRVAITSRRMVRDWDAMSGEKEAFKEAGRKGAEARWGKNRGGGNSPPKSHPNREPNSPPIANPNAKSEVIVQKSEEREPPRPAPVPKPALSPSNLLPVDRVKIELATVWPDSAKHYTGGENHDLFSSLAVLDEFMADDWLACRAWVICPDKVRGRKLWPRNRTEFVANAGEAIGIIRPWWNKGGGLKWWNAEQARPGTNPDSANAIPAAFIEWAKQNYSLSPKTCWISEPIRAEWEASKQDNEDAA